MQTSLVTTPFGRRGASLALLKKQLDTVKEASAAPIDKWQVFRDICDARRRLGLRDRALAVLNALLSFFPEAHLSRDRNLVVFPSNVRLAARANGMAATTLRENLQLLIVAGIIYRRDSPNGKRFARKGKDGEIADAYGFSLAPLLARAGEFASLAEEAAEECRHIRRLRESISLLRRDIRKLLSAAVAERVEGDWATIETEFLMVVAALARAKSVEAMSAIQEELARLQNAIVNLLDIQWKCRESDGNAIDFRQHLQNQNTESLFELEPGFEKKPDAIAEPAQRFAAARRFPLSMVLRVCPEIANYGRSGGIASWDDFQAAALVVRAMLGVSPSAYQEACDVMGRENAAVLVAYILERAGQIQSPGGYLRVLTRKAGRGHFSLGSMMMALARTNQAQSSEVSGDNDENE